MQQNGILIAGLYFSNSIHFQVISPFSRGVVGEKENDGQSHPKQVCDFAGFYGMRTGWGVVR